MTIQINEIKIGKKKVEVLPYLWAGLINLIFLPYSLLLWSMFYIHRLMDNKKDEAIKSNWIIWVKFDAYEIERRVVFETGFDGYIKFYELRTTEKSINDILKGKIFGEFCFESDYGLFLRLFDNPKRWQVSNLYFINKSEYNSHKLKKVCSSDPSWKIDIINNKKFHIITESEDNYKFILEVNTVI